MSFTAAFSLPFPRLETDRLILRGWHETDFDGFAALLADPEVARWITLEGRPQTRAIAWRNMASVIGHWVLRGFGMFVVEDKASGHFAGYAGPLRPEGRPALEIGWAISTEFQRRGYGVEAARAALGFMFDNLGEDRVIAVIHPDNGPSAALARAIGQVRAGIFELQPAGIHDLYAITRAQWQALSAG